MRKWFGTACAAVLGLGLAGQALAAEDASVDELIVTGTRVAGLRASDSAAPIQVVGQAALERTASTDLVNTLALMVPSFTAQAVGGDTANETLSARLRGLSPNHALVLINGKRRHGTSNLAILSSAYQGGAAADLNFIPPAAIARIEVLQDGAAAQYGSDAIAGVINIILKQDADGGSVDLLAGQYFEGDGDTGEISFNAGFAPAEGAFVNISAHPLSQLFQPRRPRPAGRAGHRLGRAPGVAKSAGLSLSQQDFRRRALPAEPGHRERRRRPGRRDPRLRHRHLWRQVRRRLGQFPHADPPAGPLPPGL